MQRARWLIAAAAAAALLVGTRGSAAPPATSFTIYAHTGIRLADVVWTGRRLLYVENTTNTVWGEGRPPRRFASMPRKVEETRCRMSPGTHGFPAGALFCHAPNNAIYRVDPHGVVTRFATLPESATSDGALGFDGTGRFGYRLIAATGRSGGATPAGGTVYAVDPTGATAVIGRYASAGGADELVVAPANFGSGSGQIVLTVDAGAHGELLLLAPGGRVRTIAVLPTGPNPIVAVPRRRPSSHDTSRQGLYLTDTNSTNVFFAPAKALAAAAGSLIVGAETTSTFWRVRPVGAGFRTRRIPLVVPGSHFNFEGAVYIG